MKRIIIILLVVMVTISSVSLAEDLSSRSVADLLLLYKQVSLELDSRDVDVQALYPEDDFSGSDLWGKEMADRLESFFSFWHASDIPNMLTVCSSAWKEVSGNPGADLFALLGNRTPEFLDVFSVSREPADFIRIVTLLAEMDEHDGQAPAKRILHISLMREADGLWYIDPGSLEVFDYAATGFRAEPVSAPEETLPEASDDTVLYYCPEGGSYYHADRNCQLVNEKYLPLEGTFTYAELEDEPYRDLQPCKICEAPPRP